MQVGKEIVALLVPVHREDIEDGHGVVAVGGGVSGLQVLFYHLKSGNVLKLDDIVKDGASNCYCWSRLRDLLT